MRRLSEGPGTALPSSAPPVLLALRETPAPAPHPPWPDQPRPGAMQQPAEMRELPTAEDAAAARELLAWLRRPPNTPNTPLPPLPQAQSGGLLPPPTGVARAAAGPAVHRPVVFRELPMEEQTQLMALVAALPLPPGTPQTQPGGWLPPLPGVAPAGAESAGTANGELGVGRELQEQQPQPDQTPQEQGAAAAASAIATASAAADAATQGERPTKRRRTDFHQGELDDDDDIAKKNEGAWQGGGEQGGVVGKDRRGGESARHGRGRGGEQT